MTRVVFPGSFDPITNGHIDIIVRALTIVDSVVIGVLKNPAKGSLFSAQERVEMIRRVFNDLSLSDRVSADVFNGLLVHFVREQSASAVLRGLRAISDYDYEAQLALINKRLDREIETIFMIASEPCTYISSTIVKQIAEFGGTVDELVPPIVAEELRKKFAVNGAS